MPEDRDVVAVWQLEQVGRCPQCGTFSWEWELDTEEPPWHPDHFTCQGCERLAQHQRLVEASPGSHDGLKFALFRRKRGD